MTDTNPTTAIDDVDTPAERVDALYRCVVVDRDNEKVGPVGQVYLDDATNEPTWITVNTGFLGLHETFVPLSEATIEDDIIKVPFTKDFIKNAPSIDPDGHIEQTDEAELLAYYTTTATANPSVDEDESADDLATPAWDDAIDDKLSNG